MSVCECGCGRKERRRCEIQPRAEVGRCRKVGSGFFEEVGAGFFELDRRFWSGDIFVAVDPFLGFLNGADVSSDALLF